MFLLFIVQDAHTAAFMLDGINYLLRLGLQLVCLLNLAFNRSKSLLRSIRNELRPAHGYRWWLTTISDNKSKWVFHYVPIRETVVNPSHGKKGGGLIQRFAIGGVQKSGKPRPHPTPQTTSVTAIIAMSWEQNHSDRRRRLRHRSCFRQPSPSFWNENILRVFCEVGVAHQSWRTQTIIQTV